MIREDRFPIFKDVMKCENHLAYSFLKKGLVRCLRYKAWIVSEWNYLMNMGASKTPLMCGMRP